MSNWQHLHYTGCKFKHSPVGYYCQCWIDARDKMPPMDVPVIMVRRGSEQIPLWHWRHVARAIQPVDAKPANYEETQASRTEVELGGEKLTQSDASAKPNCICDHPVRNISCPVHSASITSAEPKA